jgi:hypothetical protein
MAFADWALSSAAGGMIIQWDTLVPIQGLHSLVMVGASGNGLVYYVPGCNHTCGRIYAFHKEYDPNAPGDTPLSTHWGLAAQIQSSAAIGSNAYTLMYFPEFNQLVLSKGTSTAAFTDTTGLSSAVYGGTAEHNPDVYVMCLNWQRDPVSGSIYVAGALDGPIATPDTYDLDTLLTSKVIVQYTDGSSPYSTAVTAGILLQNSGAARKAYVDLVSIYTD